MQFNKMGRSGLTVSMVGLGCNNFGMRIDGDASREVVAAALDAGITLFDTADIYGGGKSEEFLGAALGQDRDRAVIATKFAGKTGDGPYKSGASRRYIMSSCEGSLRRLGTDYIDLYYQHYPDPTTPIEESLEALSDLVHQGKVRYLASSNFASWQAAEADHTAQQHGLQRFAGAQIEWSLLKRDVEHDIVPACRHYDIGILPYFPLASGLLSGKYHRGQAFPEGSRLAASPYFAAVATDENFAKVERLTAYAEKKGHTLLELALSWLASQPGVPSVLVGATHVDQVRANVDAVSWNMTADELAEVETALAG